MRKKRDAGLPPVPEPQPRSHVITQEREYTFITPLFGSGALTGACDEVTVIRGTEIRGHLRFWWRACYGGRYANVEDMKKDEDRIWGAAAKIKSKKKGEEKESIDEKKEREEESKWTTVQIMVETLDEGQPIEPFEIKSLAGKIDTDDKWTDEYNPASKVPAYAAFPLQLNSIERKQEDHPTSKLVYDNVKFRLTISFPQNKQREIEGALWAWETFGGIGARTRRGFGAIKLQEIALVEYKHGSAIKQIIQLEALPLANEYEVKKWIARKFSYFGVENKAPDGVPSLSKDMLEKQFYIMSSSSNAKEAWKGLIEKLRTFRQPAKGRNNQWPDTKAIKKLRDARNASPQQRYTFPKAVLGLPIVFHFADKGKDADLTLQSTKEGHDRLASALILRPLICRNNVNAVGIVLLLENHVENHKLSSDALQVVTKDKKEKPGIFDAKLSYSEARDTVLRGETDVWKAFMMHMNKNNNLRGNNR